MKLSDLRQTSEEIKASLSHEKKSKNKENHKKKFNMVPNGTGVDTTAPSDGA